MGSNGQEGQLEQIYKQRHFADFFNGIEGWNLERRTRAFGWPPFISRRCIFECRRFEYNV